MRPYLPIVLALFVACKDGAPRDVKRVAAFSDAEGDDCPEPRAPLADVPPRPDWAKLNAALAADTTMDGALEVVSAPSGCGRIVERRSGGDVKRWEYWRKKGRKWSLWISWDFAPGMKRPTFRRVILFGHPVGDGELAGKEVVTKSIDGRIWKLSDLDRSKCAPNLSDCHPGGLPVFDDDVY